MDILHILYGPALKDLAKIAIGGSGTDNVVINPNPINSSLMEDWIISSKKVNATVPDEQGFICKVQTSGLNFSGLHVKTVANIGAQIVHQSEHDGVTETQLEFTYIDDEQIVQGPKILVFIFNALTGKDLEGSSSRGKGQRVQSLSRLYTTVSNNTVVFHIDTNLDISIQFPTLLLKLLPVSKEKAEEQGSEVIMNTLTKDTEAMIPKLEEFYLQTREKHKNWRVHS
jgi:hypothetical protein